jgi:hypothetical protein
VIANREPRDANPDAAPPSGTTGGLSSLVSVRSEIQSDLCPPPEAYQLRAALGDAVRVGGHQHQTYVNGTIRGSRITLRRYDDREDRRWAGWTRPKLVGSISPHGDGSVVRYRIKLRPFWILPAVFVVVGVIAFAAGLYSLGRTHTEGPRDAIYDGAVFAVIGTALTLSLAAGTKKESAPLEDWLADRCSRHTLTSPVVSSDQGWYPDPHGGCAGGRDTPGEPTPRLPFHRLPRDEVTLSRRTGIVRRGVGSCCRRTRWTRWRHRSLPEGDSYRTGGRSVDGKEVTVVWDEVAIG